ncbi:MAG: hypothetical protein ACXWNJ_07135 [Vulcanimicrobiaceae bacterium]
MPAHHRFHPYEIQTLAFFLSLLPFFALTAIMFAARIFGNRDRARKPPLRYVPEPIASKLAPLTAASE